MSTPVFKREEIFIRCENEIKSVGIGYKSGNVTFQKISDEMDNTAYYQVDVYGLKVGYAENFTNAKTCARRIAKALVDSGKQQNIDCGFDNKAWGKELIVLKPVVRKLEKQGLLFRF